MEHAATIQMAVQDWMAQSGIFGTRTRILCAFRSKQFDLLFVLSGFYVEIRFAQELERWPISHVHKLSETSSPKK